MEYGLQMQIKISEKLKFKGQLPVSDSRIFINFNP